MSYEANFDGLPGPTHNYSGLAYGNIPSMEHKNISSNPKAAALQSLKKMHLLGSRGLIQGVLPPHERPHLPTLRLLGFGGSDKQLIEQAHKEAPALFLHCCSSSAMWAANSATVTPAIDSGSGRTQFTPANLSSSFHRSIEAPQTSRLLKKIFNDPLYFSHHAPLPSTPLFSDEGAANHIHLCSSFDSPGLHLFVYGKHGGSSNAIAPHHFPARQSSEASEAVARRHGIYPTRLLFAQQSPQAIDAGVFHNDVASVGHQNLFLYHEEAFVDTAETIAALEQAFSETCNSSLCLLPISKERLSLEEAVSTYLFNSQIITNKEGFMTLIAPMECKENRRAASLLEEIINEEENPIQELLYVPLRESMQNGGGPACLRLRVPLAPQEVEAINSDLLLSEALYSKLVHWVEKHYRDRLSPGELADPQLYEESKSALDELTHILNLGSFYSFQKAGGADG